MPVRIAFDGHPTKPLIAGLSADRHGRSATRPLAAWPHPAQLRELIRCRRGQRIIVTIAVMMAVLLQVLDTTIANVALPHMQASLGATQESDQLGADQLYRRLGHRACRSPAGWPTGSGASGCC